MARSTAISLAFVFLLTAMMLPAIMPRTMPVTLSSLSGPSEAWAQANRTDHMQQSDYKRRVANQKKPEPVKQQMAGVLPSESAADTEDYLVLVILIASVVILAFIASRGTKSRSRSRPRF